jgi:hypothetical protein
MQRLDGVLIEFALLLSVLQGIMYVEHTLLVKAASTIATVVVSWLISTGATIATKEEGSKCS